MGKKIMGGVQFTTLSRALAYYRTAVPILKGTVIPLLGYSEVIFSEIVEKIHSHKVQ